MSGSFNSPAQRCRQLQRVLLLIELVSPLRFGATVDELHREMVETHGEEVCRRTIFRDLEALESLGYVERGSRRLEGCKWRWMRQARTEQLIRLPSSSEPRRETLAQLA